MEPPWEAGYSTVFPFVADQFLWYVMPIVHIEMSHNCLNKYFNITVICRCQRYMLSCHWAGHTTLYYGLGDRGYLYLALSALALFLYDEASAYYYHRMYHSPLLYRWIHKAHHRYGCPTAFSAVAMHPLEMLHYQAYLAAPAFIVPVHAGAFYKICQCTFYFRTSVEVSVDSIYVEVYIFLFRSSTCLCVVHVVGYPYIQVWCS